MSKYIDRVLEECRQKNAGEPEFLQTVEEVLTSLAPVIDAHPEYEKASLLERMIEPEPVSYTHLVSGGGAVVFPHRPACQPNRAGLQQPLGGGTGQVRHHPGLEGKGTLHEHADADR